MTNNEIKQLKNILIQLKNKHHFTEEELLVYLRSELSK